MWAADGGIKGVESSEVKEDVEGFIVEREEIGAEFLAGDA